MVPKHACSFWVKVCLIVTDDAWREAWAWSPPGQAVCSRMRVSTLPGVSGTHAHQCPCMLCCLLLRQWQAAAHIQRQPARLGEDSLDGALEGGEPGCIQVLGVQQQLQDDFPEAIAPAPTNLTGAQDAADGQVAPEGLRGEQQVLGEGPACTSEAAGTQAWHHYRPQIDDPMNDILTSSADEGSISQAELLAPISPSAIMRTQEASASWCASA